MKLSFVIPTYNSVVWLPHAVTSALEQTYKDIEVVIVDDGSKDKTGEYLSWVEKKDSRVKAIRNKRNEGRSAARNIGNLAAQGEIILVLDADDLATPNRAEITARKFKNGTADYIYGAATVIDAIGSPYMVVGADTFDKTRAVEKLENGIMHSTAAYTREFAEKFPYEGGKFSKLGIDDWQQQIRGLFGGARFDFVPQRLGCYRVFDSNDQITKSRNKEEVKAAKLEFLKTLQVAA